MELVYNLLALFVCGIAGIGFILLLGLFLFLVSLLILDSIDAIKDHKYKNDSTVYLVDTENPDYKKKVKLNAKNNK